MKVISDMILRADMDKWWVIMLTFKIIPKLLIYLQTVNILRLKRQNLTAEKLKVRYTKLTQIYFFMLTEIQTVELH